MADPKWKEKFSTGSPLASGTNFTTVAFLQAAYGWDYFKSLKSNKTIAEGGNSSVLRRVQTKERPVGWVLLENVLRFQDSKSLKVVYPEDGVVIQSNNLAILKKNANQEAAQKVADWMFEQDGQQAMVKSFMYSVTPGFKAPDGAPSLAEIQSKAKPWTQEFIDKTMAQRESLKEEFTKIMFQ
jgi:iron(III) transport system substrate-binding protein